MILSYVNRSQTALKYFIANNYVWVYWHLINYGGALSIKIHIHGKIYDHYGAINMETSIVLRGETIWRYMWLFGGTAINIMYALILVYVEWHKFLLW